MPTASWPTIGSRTGMPLLGSDTPIGEPAFSLTDDQVATVVDLMCRGANEARRHVCSGMLEVPITIVVRKAMRRVKGKLGLTNLQIQGEVEIDDGATPDPSILGRIDITLQFLHQFGNEDAYVAIECKRVRACESSLNAKYVSKGVDRFVIAKYAAGHAWGFMLGYVLALPVDHILKAVKRHIRHAYGDSADPRHDAAHPLSLAILDGSIAQSADHKIRLKHVFVDMTAAA